MYIIPSKLYYLVSTGKVLTAIITPNCPYPIETTTKEEDIEIYEQLKDKLIDDIDYIELEYETLASMLTNIKSYSVNLETKTLDCVYYTQEELDAIQQQNQEAQELDSRVSDISTYLSNLDSTAIYDIENSILEIEKNKIINGGM